jgi:putative acetyltransferase
MGQILRDEVPADAAAIHALTAAAFLNAPHTDHSEQFVVDALREAGALAISLVVEDAGTIIGHVAVSPVAISDGAAGWFGLGPISVSPERQGQGIGSILMRRALLLLRERGAAGCVLLGDPGYYYRFGFRPEAALVLPDVPPEYFQAIAFTSALPRGIVTYHRAFNARG